MIHCHMLFHLPHPFMRGRERIEVERALDRLIDRQGHGNYADYTLKLTFPTNPNGIYLLKGGDLTCGGSSVSLAVGENRRASSRANVAAPLKTLARRRGERPMSRTIRKLVCPDLQVG